MPANKILNKTSKEINNAEYLSMLDKSMEEAKQGGLIVKTLDELEEYE